VIAEPRTWVDVEAAVREWARDAVSAVNRRVFFGANNAAARPQIVLFRVAGPDDLCLIQFDVRAASKEAAASAAAELATAADGLSRFSYNGVLLLGATVDSIRWLPDEEMPVKDSARYIVEVTFTAIAEN
jgi:hypothetical protein